MVWKYSGWAAFNDYEIPEQFSRNQSSECGDKPVYKSLPFGSFKDDPIGAAHVPLVLYP